jgi:photosystem II stability/assembly factor-like uncharacterized protein
LKNKLHKSTGQYQSAVIYSGNIYTSSDYGANWTSRDSVRDWRNIVISSTGQYQLAIGGTYLYISTDHGVNWTAKKTDTPRTWYWIDMDATGRNQIAIVYGEYLYVSNDFGDTWTAKKTDASRQWMICKINK